MTQKRFLAPDFEKAEPVTLRNPYIINFCKILVEKRGEQLEPEALKKLINDMYRLYENMLGQNMVKALPEKAREEYRVLCEDLSNVNYEEIERIFDKNISNHDAIMKETLKEFAEIFMKNRGLNPKDYPLSPNFDSTQLEFKEPKTEDQ